MWLECKFLRGQAGDEGNRHAGNKSPATGAILADLLRLALLIPEASAKTSSSRYLLHVYDADPKFYLTYRGRPWCKSLVTVGAHDIHISGLDAEPRTVRRMIGDLPDLDIKLKVTNFHAGPLHVEHRPIYWCWLTRIDKIEATLGQHTATIDVNRIITQAGGGLAEIAAFVAERISIVPESPDAQPPRLDEQEDVLHDGNEVNGAVRED